MKQDIKENKNIIMWIEDGVLYGVYKKNSIIDLQAAEEIIQLRKSITLDKVYPALVEVSNIGNVTKQARIYLASEDACEGFERMALIISSNFSKILVNLFMQINKPKVRTKVFTDKKIAKKWLNNRLNEAKGELSFGKTNELF